MVTFFWGVGGWGRFTIFMPIFVTVELKVTSASEKLNWHFFFQYVVICSWSVSEWPVSILFIVNVCLSSVQECQIIMLYYWCLFIISIRVRDSYTVHFCLFYHQNQQHAVYNLFIISIRVTDNYTLHLCLFYHQN